MRWDDIARSIEIHETEEVQGPREVPNLWALF